MGGRLIRRWLTHPLKQLDSIQERLKRVEILFEQRTVRKDIRESLKRVGISKDLFPEFVSDVVLLDIRQLGFLFRCTRFIGTYCRLESDILCQELQSLHNTSGVGKLH